MADLRIMILCGQSPRHLYVANRLCRAVEVTAIVHETGSHWDAAKLRRLALVAGSASLRRQSRGGLLLRHEPPRARPPGTGA